MSMQSIINLNVDFYDKKYILVNAKQYDKNSRFLSVTCYNHGELYPVNDGEHSAYIRYKKADNNSVFNFCEIDRKGKIIVELTEQMLAADGICCADLVIVNEGSAQVDAQTGEITGIANASILSTMPIHIDVTGSAVANSDIESSYEFNGLNTALEKAEAEYTDVILTSKSWAVGNTGTRDGENTDNAKYYAKQASSSASAANTSALNAANSEALVEEYIQDALIYSQNAQTYMNKLYDINGMNILEVGGGIYPTLAERICTQAGKITVYDPRLTKKQNDTDKLTLIMKVIAKLDRHQLLKSYIYLQHQQSAFYQSNNQ